MSFSAEVFTKKLSVLQDTQDSIVSISQWVLFHHRHAHEAAAVWKRVILQDKAAGKKLSLLYLCNDVVQQAKRKRKTEFITEFAGVLPEVLNKIYLGLDANIKLKVDRLIKVWEERGIFSGNQISGFRSAIKKSIDTESAAVAQANTLAFQVKTVNDLFLQFNKLTNTANGNYTQFNIQANNYLGDNQDNLPSPKIYISKLNVLQKLGNISRGNLKDLQAIKNKLKPELTQLLALVDDAEDTEKISKIETTLTKLVDTRNELKLLLPDSGKQPEEPSPEFDPVSSTDDSSSRNADVEEDDDDDLVPTYEDSDDDSATAVDNTTEEVHPGQPSLKRRASATPSGGSTPKKVAFSEDIEVKEFEREENSAEQVEDSSKEDLDFVVHHRDVLELKHEHDKQIRNSHMEIANDDSSSASEYNIESTTNDEDDDGYDPELRDGPPEETGNSDVMSLLMKLT